MKLFRVEDVEISPDQREIRRNGEPVKLRPMAFDLLVYLVSHRDRVVAKEELLDQLWKGTAVTENSLMQCVAELRKALNDDSRQPRLIKTVSKSGYRFIGAVEELGTKPSAVQPARRRIQGMVALALLTVVLLLTGLWWRTSTREAAAPPWLTKNLDAYRSYLQGVQQAQQFHVKQALESFEKAVSLDPEFAMAHARIGVTHLFWSRHDEATPHLERAFRLAGRLRDQDRLYVAAWYAQAGHDYEAAARTYKELLGRFPEELEACQQLARLLIGEERFDEARRIIQAALKLNPASPKTYSLLSELELNTFHFDEAVAAAQRFVALAPTEPNALDSLGLSHEARGDFREAENAYRAALRLQPDFEIAVVHLGNALTRQGRYKEAEETYKRYIRVTASPQDRLRGYVSLGLLHRLQGDIVRAREAAQHNPNGEAAILLALDRGDVALAESLLSQRQQGSDRGRRISQRFLLYLYGQRALSAGNLAEAFSHFRQALQTLTPFWSFDWYEDCLGDAFLKAGQPDAAIQEYQRVLQRYPKLALVWYHLAQAYARKGLPLQERNAMSRVLEIWREADRDVPEWISASRVVGQTPIAGIARATQSDSTPSR